MRCIQVLFKSFFLALLITCLAFANTGTESTTDDGFTCGDGETKHAGTYCNGQFCQICNVCGDEYVVADAGEECDDNAGNGPLLQCNTDCKKTFCGDELIQPLNGFDVVEQCDLGANNSNTGTCSENCQITVCGDGYIQAPNGEGETEECDNAAENHPNGLCNPECQITKCGDQILQQPNGEGVVEQCDYRDFAAGFTLESHICKTDCTAEERNADFILKAYFRKIGSDALIPATAAQPGTGFDYQEDFVIVYEVENLGNVDLKDIVVTDDRGSTITVVNNADGDDILGTGEKWLFETETISPALPEQFEVNALIEAVDTDLDAKVVLSRTESGYFCKDKDGDQVFCTTCVNCGNDRAKLFYEVLPTPGIKIIAYVKINDGEWKSADQLDDLSPRATDQIYFKYDVINTGNVPLSGVTVTHTYTNGGETVTETLTLDQRTESGNGDNILDYQESWTYEVGPIELKEGTFTLTATVTATDPDGNQISDTIDTQIVIEVGPELCDYNVFDMTYHSYGSGYRQDKALTGEEVPKLTCLTKTLGELYGVTDRCANYVPFDVKTRNEYAGDDCIVRSFRAESGAGTVYNEKFILDDECQIIAYGSAIDDTKICSNNEFHWTGSPISLLWDEGATVNASVTLSSFPIDPRAESAVYQWKASSATPLLVYDPEHMGEIVSATQLFGNWTYGSRTPELSKQIAMQSGSVEQPVWNNGYEALAILDQNGDEQLTGTELNDLALWFDHNQNGISEAGEVQSVVEAGVLSLSVQHDYTDSLGDIYSSVGYTRINQDGSIFSNQTVDWFSPVFASESQALGYLSATANQSFETDIFPDNSDLLSSKSVKFKKGFLTSWKYEIEPKFIADSHQDLARAFNKGFLRLGVDPNGQVVGYTAAEVPIKSKVDNAKSMVRTYQLNGQLVDDYTIQFQIRTDDGTVLNTTAVLTAEDKMIAKTRMSLELKEGERSEIEYFWQAERYK